MEIVVLGSGGAFRLPCPSCHCANCEAARSNPALRRTTTCLWLHDGASILLDAGPDLYHQALREGIDGLDGIFLTHAHRDHALGLECMETFVRYGRQGRAMPVFGAVGALVEVSRQFGYLLHLGLIELHPLEPGRTIEFGSYRLTPFDVLHHHIATFGYRVEQGGRAIVHCPDIKALPGDEPLEHASLPAAMTGADILFIDGTFDETTGSGPGHISWQMAAKLGERSGAQRTVLIHISHRVDLVNLRRFTGDRLLEGHDGERFSL